MKPSELKERAQDHLDQCLRIALEHSADHRAIIVYDAQSQLSKLLADAYRALLPEAEVYDFDRCEAQAILERFNTLAAGELIVLVESDNFRLSQFRIRIELFKRGLKVIEHPHLGRIQEPEFETYIDALAYDPSYYRSMGSWLKTKIAQATGIRIVGEGTELRYQGPFLDPKLNIGCYEGMKNIGGRFPIGELFTEPKIIENVNGTVKIFAFGDSDFSVNIPDKPFTVSIEKGILHPGHEAPLKFLSVLDEIRKQETVVWVRELGFGLNRAMHRGRTVSDIGTFERMCGIHLSLGAKHLQYKKPEFPKKGGFHVDVFVDAQSVEIDGVEVFRNGAYAPVR